MAEKTILHVLADGQLSSTIQPIYAVNQDIEVEVHQIVLVNKDSAERTVNLYLRVRHVTGEWGDPRLMTPSGLILDPGDLTYVLDDPIQLSMSDQILGVADIANLVDYWMTGIEHDKSYSE